MIPFYPFVLVEFVVFFEFLVLHSDVLQQTEINVAKCWVSPTVAETLTKTNFHLQW